MNLNCLPDNRSLSPVYGLPPGMLLMNSAQNIQAFFSIVVKSLVSTLLFMFTGMQLFAQDSNAIEAAAAYRQTINERAGKIVTTLQLKDSAKAFLVQQIIAGQYIHLNDIYTNRDNKLKALKAGTYISKETELSTRKQVEDETKASLDSLHVIYLQSLSAELTPEQVNQVKDGMTYGVVQVTYKGYQSMILNLTDEQKKQILAWLVEARELAMDAESADKKHAWFGKYKGRINNYLSAAGYDLRKEGEEWQKRIKAEQTVKASQ